MEVATRANLVFLARKLLEEEENSVVTEEDFKVFVVKLLDYVSVLKKFRVTEDKGEEGEAEGREEVGEGVEEGEEEEGGEDLPGGEEGELFTELQYRQGEPCFIWSTVVICRHLSLLDLVKQHLVGVIYTKVFFSSKVCP